MAISNTTFDVDRSRGCGLSVGVPGCALVHAAVLGVHAQQVQADVVKVVGRTELVAWESKRFDFWLLKVGVFLKLRTVNSKLQNRTSPVNEVDL